MGMDVYHYEIKKPLSIKEFSIDYDAIHHCFDCYHDNTTYVMLDERMKEWYLKHYSPEFIRTVNQLDYATWLLTHPQFDDESPLYEGWKCDTYEFKGLPSDWIMFYRPKEDGTEETLLVNELVYQKKEVVFFEVNEIGYMRKPFRHEDMPSYYDPKENATVITVTNFSGKGQTAHSILRSISQTQAEQGNVYIMDVEQMEKLKPYTDLPEVMQTSFIDNFKENSLVCVNW